MQEPTGKPFHFGKKTELFPKKAVSVRERIQRHERKKCDAHKRVALKMKLVR